MVRDGGQRARSSRTGRTNVLVARNRSNIAYAAFLLDLGVAAQASHRTRFDLANAGH